MEPLVINVAEDKESVYALLDELLSEKKNFQIMITVLQGEKEKILGFNHFKWLKN